MPLLTYSPRVKEFFAKSLLLGSLTFSGSAFANSAKVKVIAHRGSSGYLPEHTIAAKSLAYGQGADYLEQDVVATKDKKLVVLHDLYLECVSDVTTVFPNRARNDGRFYVIDFTWKELQKLSLSERRACKKDAPATQQRYPNRYQDKTLSFKIVSLEQEVAFITELNRISGKKVGLAIESKDPEFHSKNGINLVQLMVDELSRLDLENRAPFFIQSFSPQSLKDFKKAKPSWTRIQLIGQNNWFKNGVDYEAMLTPKGLENVSKHAAGISPWIPQLVKSKDSNFTSTGIAELAAKRKLEVIPFTARIDGLVGGFKDYNQMLGALLKVGITSIFTDQPKETKDYLCSVKKCIVTSGQ